MRSVRLVFVFALTLFACAFAAQCFADSSAVRLECSADNYALGDSVFFVWTNDTDSTLSAGNRPPYEIYDATNGALIYWGPLPMEYALAPHHSVELSWDQRDGFGLPVPAGSYTVVIGYVFNDAPPGFSVEDRFSILVPASVPDANPPVVVTTWGKLRRHYR